MLSIFSVCIVESNHFDVAQGDQSFKTFLGTGPIAGKNNNTYVLNYVLVVLGILLGLFQLESLLDEFTEMRYWGWKYFWRVDNILDLTMCVALSFMLVSFSLFWKWETTMGVLSMTEPLAGITTLIYYVKSMWYLQGFRATGPLIRMILQIITDIAYLILLLVIILFGATFAFYTLTDGARQITDLDQTEPGVNGWFDQLANLWYYMYQALLLGGFGYEDLNMISFPGIGKGIFILLTFFVLIVILNLLIALMSDSYERIKVPFLPSLPPSLPPSPDGRTSHPTTSILAAIHAR